jgi:DNA (cytosine-5)-methyltransferase 1
LLASSHSRIEENSETFIPEVASTLRSEGHDASEDGSGRQTLVPEVWPTLSSGEGGRLTNQAAENGALLPIPVDLAQLTHPENRSNPQPGDPAGTLASTARPAVAIHATQDPISIEDASLPLETSGYAEAVAQCHGNNVGPVGTLRSGNEGGVTGGNPFFAVDEWRVRRLMPIEWERLQGVPDGYTRISWMGKPVEDCPDAPRYYCLGNGMAVPVMEWLGRRIEFVDRIGAD